MVGRRLILGSIVVTLGTSCGLLPIPGAGGGSGGAGGGSGGGGGSTSGGSADWQAQDPGAGSWLAGVHCPSPTSCVAVGVVVGMGQAVILRTTNGGDAWQPVTAPAGSKGLSAVHFPDAMTGYAVGGDTFSGDGTILKTVDGGLTWTAQVPGTKGALSGIHCTSASTCLAVGGDLSAKTALILKTVNGGAAWTAFLPPATTANSLAAVHCVDPSVCHAVGTYFGVSVVLRSTDGGGSWGKVFHTENTIGAMRGVQFFDANVGVAVGTGRIEKTTNGGALWKNQPASIFSLGGVSCLDASRCLVVGAVGGIFKTTNGGTTWMKQEAGTGNSLSGVHWVDANTAYIVGDNIADGKNATLLKMRNPNGSTGVDVAASCCDGDGGVGTVTISAAGASNVNEAPMSTARVSGFYANGGGAVIWVQDSPAPGHLRMWGLNMNNRPTTGRVFPLPEQNMANNTWSGLTLTAGDRTWKTASGTCTVDTVAGRAVAVTVRATMTPDTAGTGQPAVGNFTVDLKATLNEMGGL